MNERPKFHTAEQCITALRERATTVACQLLQDRNTRSERSHHVIRRNAELDAVCTAIEILHEDGNYYPERMDAMERAEKRVRES